MFNRNRLFVLLAGTVLSSTAVFAQQMKWQLLDDGDPPQGAFLMSYDLARSREVLYAWPKTWELVSGEWRRVFTDQPPAAGSCVAFDSIRDYTVVFGTYPTPDTWTYDGGGWVKRTTAHSPPFRFACGMTFDSDRGVVVLFGGLDDSNVYNDTWEFDGTDWSRVTTNVSPPPRYDIALAYDSSSRRTVLFGGHGSGALGDTWEYDGRNWREKRTTVSPSARWANALAYDPQRNVTVLFGGSTASIILDDTWEWNGNSWTLKNPANSPSGRARMQLVYDAGMQTLVGEGGFDSNETFTYDGVTWNRIALSTAPLPREGMGFVYNPAEDRLVLYGGRTAYPINSLWDTWKYDFSSWVQMTDVGQPHAYRLFPLAYDSEAEVITGFGGDNGFSADEYFNSLANGEGSAWASFIPGGPDARAGHIWVRAPGQGGTVLFGGMQYGSISYNDTWLWNGVSFSPVPTPTRPAIRSFAAAAYSPTDNQILMYGGTSDGGSTGLSDLWSFDGNAWTLIASPNPPGPRMSHGMAYDLERAVYVLYGWGPIGEGVTWEYDGQTWRAVSTPFQPDTDREWPGLTYDGRRGVTFLFGGRETGWANDLWAYGPDPDGDGIVGGLDNCRTTSNVGQANQDGDPAGDACDCDGADGQIWAAPGEATDQVLSHDRVTGTTTLSWTAPIEPGAVAWSYDTLRSSNPADFLVGATCLESGGGDTSSTDTESPAGGGGFYYLVRGVNACPAGQGSLGTRSDGQERLGRVCP